MIRTAAALLILTAAASGAGLVPVDEAGYSKLVAAGKGQVVLVNFWATWCAPCRKEMPGLVAIERRLKARGFRLVTISADEPEDAAQARIFLERNGAAAPHYLKRVKDDDKFINALDPKWSGALPASFLYDRRGRKVKSYFGEVSLKELEAAIQALL